MNLHEIHGTVTSLGQSAFNNDVVVYAYVEITNVLGERTVIEKVAVCNDVGIGFGVGVCGTFYVDRIFRVEGWLRCQLFGIKTAARSIIDKRDLRKETANAKIVMGIVTLPIIGIGLLLLIPGVHLLILSAQNDRRRFFVGAGSLTPPPIPETLRI